MVRLFHDSLLLVDFIACLHFGGAIAGFKGMQELFVPVNSPFPGSSRCDDNAGGSQHHRSSLSFHRFPPNFLLTMRTYYCKAGSDMEASTTREVPPRALAALGVKIWSCDVANYQSELGRAAKEYGYPADAVLETFDSTLAGGCHGSQDKYEKMRDQYQERYTFPEDCVACVLSGQTMFDVDDPLGGDNSTVIRIVLVTGDCFSLPAGLTRRAYPDKDYKSAFIMKGSPGFKEITANELENHPVRKSFLKSIGLE